MGQVNGEYPLDSAVVAGVRRLAKNFPGSEMRCIAAVAVLPERLCNLAEVAFDARAGYSARRVELRLGDELDVHAFALNRSNDTADPSVSNGRVG